MKKTIFIAVLILTTLTLKAQKATFQNDTARYAGRIFVIKDTITLGYGCRSDKNFAFIRMGSGMTGTTELDCGWAKHDAVIEKFFFDRSTVYLRAMLIDKTVNLVGGNKLFIFLEAALDNKELK